jgi:hypothetical protein
MFEFRKESSPEHDGIHLRIDAKPAASAVFAQADLRRQVQDADRLKNENRLPPDWRLTR